MSDEEEPSFIFPSGLDDVAPAVRAIHEYVKPRGQKLVFNTLLEEDRLKLEAAFPGKFQIEPLRDFYDYVYEAERMISLSGKKLSAKRNHINKFKLENPNWEYEVITPENIEEFNCLNQRYLDQYYGQESIDTVVIDLDSTHCDTFGKQEGSDFNNHYRTFGYHPLVAFDAVTGLFLKAQLRKGNVYTSTEVVPFLEPLLKHLIEDLNVSHILIRGDSGFAVPALYELCETYEVKYIIRLKANARLNRTAESFIFRNESYPVIELERQFDAFDYRANSWKKERTVVLQNERPAGKLLFTPLFIVTNMEGIIPEIIVKLYKNRGLMENFIKEAKLGFFMDKTDSSKFVINEARMWLGVLSYNIIQLMKSWVFPPSMKKWTIGTIRQRLIKVATKIVSHAGKIHFKLYKLN